MSVAATITNIFTGFFLLIVLSYYILLLVPRSRGRNPMRFRSITIVIPAHNEERFIADAIQSVLAARFDGEKEVIVVDDGSRDKTAQIASSFPVKVLRTEHQGKSNAINKAVAQAHGDLIAIVDGDSAIHDDALEEAAKLFHDEKVAAVCAVIKVKNRSSLLGMWLHLEQLYASLTRALVAKVNANIVAAGPLSLFRKDRLNEIGGFGTKGFAEDADIAIRLIKAGYRVEYAEKAFTETNMPVTLRGFFKQRSRFARGTVNIIRRHIKVDRHLVRIYTLPLILFGYLQAVIMSVITLYNIGLGYWTYFGSKGLYFNWWVVKFFVGWLSIYGILNWFWNVVTGVAPATAMTIVGLTASLLSYPLYLFAVFKYDRRTPLRQRLFELLCICFFFPFWILVMLVYLANIPEWGRKHQHNIWEKA